MKKESKQNNVTDPGFHLLLWLPTLEKEKLTFPL